MTDNRPYIEIGFTGDTLTQYSSNTLMGTNIVIDYGDGTTINYNGNYSHTYSEFGDYTIRIYGVTSIGNNCFNQCFDLTSIIIPDNVTSIGDNCFSQCSNLTSIVIPNSVTRLGNSCFMDCSMLGSIIIPDSVTSIEDFCFCYCVGLTNVIISDSVTSIGYDCFTGCTGLTDIQLNWTSSTDILTYDSSWIIGTDSSLVFHIPQGTTSLYEAKGYPSAKLVEQSPTTSSHDLFTDVKTLFLNNKEVESITYGSGIIYQKEHTNVTLTTTATNNTITYGDSLVLNGTVSNLNGASVKLYQNDTLIDTLTTDSNGTFTKTFNNLNAGTYTYKAVYDGDNTHYDGQSNGVIITVNKATPVLTLSSDKSVIHYNETVILSGTTTVNGTIKIYQTGEPTLLSSVESNNGTFTYTFTNQSQDNIQIYANIESTSNYNQASSNIVTLTYNEYYSTNLTIEVPALVYSDVFDVTGVLTDENNNGVSGESVKLIRDGSILEATETTDSNGEVTFHRSAPTSITTYTFQLVFDGDSSYSNSSSSVVSRTVGKETSVLNITSPNNNSNITQGNDLTITGNLSDNDATPMTGKTVIVKAKEVLNLTANKNILSYYDEDEAVLTATYIANDNTGKRVTFSGAEFDVTMTNEMDLTFGNEATISNIQMTQDGSSIYIGNPNDLLLIQNLGEGSYGLARVQDNFPTRIDYMDISLGFSYNGNTLSYYDNNGTLATYDITGLAKRIVSSSTSFSVVSSAIGVLTDSNGVATVSYTSQGVGDVTITTECDNVTDTIEIEDCEFISSTEYHVTGAQNVRIESDFSFQNGDWELISNFRGAHNGEQFGVADAISSSSSSLKCFASSVKQGNNYYLTGLQGLTDTSQEVWIRSTSYMDTSTYYPMKIRKEGTILYYYFNGNLMDTVTSNEFASVEYLSLFIRTYYSDDSQGIYVKDIKLKRI